MKAVLTEGSVTKIIIRLGSQMFIGMIGIVGFNLVDTFFIGKLGEKPLAAMGFTFPIIMLQGSISMGLGLGASAVISRAIGAGDKNLMRRLTTDSLFLSLTIVIIFVSIGLFTINPLFTALGATQETIGYIQDYISIWYLGVPFVVIPMIGNNAIRAAGNTFIPSMIMIAAIIINSILDPLLIFGIGIFPRMELKGAALATVCTRFVTLFLSLSVLHFKYSMLTKSFPGFLQLWNSWKQILFIGVPAAITHLVNPLSIMIITRFVATFGSAAVAAFGVGTKIELFALSPIMAVSSIIVPFTGQNFGAKKISRIQEGLRVAFIISLCLGILFFAIFYLFGTKIASLFNTNPAIIHITTFYLTISSVGLGLQGILPIVASSMSALKKPFHAAALNFLRMVGIYVPLAWILMKYVGIGGIFISNAIASVLVGITAILWIHKIVKYMQ